MLQHLSSYVKKSLRFLMEIALGGTWLHTKGYGTEGDRTEGKHLLPRQPQVCVPASRGSCSERKDARLHKPSRGESWETHRTLAGDSP